MPNKPITIYDTGIVVQATLNPDSVAKRALLWAEGNTIEAIMHNRLRQEYEDTLKRLAAEDEYPQLQHPDVIENQLARIDATILLVPNAPRQVTCKRDPQDAPTIDLAIYTQADFLVARDKDLLVLNDDPEFRRACPDTQVVNPVEFVQEMERLHKQAPEDNERTEGDIPDRD